MTEHMGITAMLLDVAASQAADPVSRFIASLSDEEPGHLRTYALDTLRLRDELVTHTQALLTSHVREAVHHAAWLQKNAGEVAYRWATLRATVVRWSELQTEAVRFRCGP